MVTGLAPENLADGTQLVRRYRLTNSFDGAESQVDTKQDFGALSTESASARNNGAEG